MATYYVKELFYSLQGEGHNTGRAAVFCRFTGCNLRCGFCDTDFDGADAGIFPDEDSLVRAIVATFPPLPDHVYGFHRPYVILTGGEPALQITQELIDALHYAGISIGVETNGTLPLPEGLDWVAVSPKGQHPLVVTSGDELKLVWPQPDCTPDDFSSLNFSHFYLQVRDAPNQNYTNICMEYCLQNPQWKLGLQTHKIIGIR